MALSDIAEKAQRHGFVKVRPDPHSRQTYWRIQCSACPKYEQKSWGPDTSVDIMVRNMRRMGWEVDRGKDPLCPNCAHPRKGSTPSKSPTVDRENRQREQAEAEFDKLFQPKTKEPEKVVELAQLAKLPALAHLKVELETAPPKEEPKMTPRDRDPQRVMPRDRSVLVPDMKVTRRVIALLEQNFDEGKHMYLPSWSDERVASEAQTSYSVVASIRKEAYGELAEDPVVTNLKERIEAVKTQWRNDLQAHMAAIDQKRTDVLAEITHLEEALKQLTERRQAS